MPDKIQVTITDGINGPEISVDDSAHPGKKNEKWKHKMEHGGLIQWDIDDETTRPGQGNWEFGCIEFEQKGAGEFEPRGGSRNRITVYNHCRRTDKFKYTIWVVPRDGFGAPVALDPIIENDPGVGPGTGTATGTGTGTGTGAGTDTGQIDR